MLELLSYLPIVDLIGDLISGNPAPSTTAGLLYDVGQALAVLLVIAKGAAWVATKTETQIDDRGIAFVTYWISRAIKFLAEISSAQK